MPLRPALAALLAAAALPAAASDAVRGETTEFRSPNGVVERCVRIAPMPGAVHSDGDLKREARYCAIDLHAPDVALCPKTWSTSAGMMIYALTDGPYARERERFQRNACAEGKGAADLASDTLAKFKPTLNAKGTSGTFSAAPLLYYQFSRFFEAEAKVPPAVWRSMDRAAHRSEVAERGLAISGHGHSSRMNHEAWRLLAEADADPARYSPTDELFTADRTAIYGVLLESPGHRYGAEVNGTRKSGWGKGQNLDFQETAPFLALRADAPLAEAIAEGLAGARRDAQLRRDTGDATPEQMAFWMRELAEIVLLDFIFSQQDRVGNIDYTVHWVWAEGGKMHSRKADAHAREDPPAPGAQRIKRTQLNDNDAGGRVQYANFAKSTQMLEKLRRFPAVTYRKLMALDADLQAGGPLHAHVSSSFGLDAAQVRQIIDNVALAAGILRASCARGALRFDLEPEEFLVTGTVVPAAVPCGG